MDANDTMDWKQKVPPPRKEDTLTTNTNDAMDKTKNEKAQPKGDQRKPSKNQERYRHRLLE
jgi:hypothetical protein